MFQPMAINLDSGVYRVLCRDSFFQELPRCFADLPAVLGSNLGQSLAKPEMADVGLAGRLRAAPTTNP